MGDDFEYDAEFEREERSRAFVTFALGMFLFIALVFSALLYIWISIRVSLDYDEVCSKSYHVVENANKRDEFMALLVNQFKQQELKESGGDEENFVATPLLQDLLDAKENYEHFKPSNFRDYNAANQRYSTSMVAYLNYVAKNKPDTMTRTERYHVSYIVEYNRNMLSAMEHHNRSIEEYIHKFDNPVYAFVAKKDKEYYKFSQVEPFDLTDYLSGISSDWDLLEDQKT